jgi:hypothetical protein
MPNFLGSLVSMIGKYSVLIGLFPYGHIIDDRLMTWVVRLCEELGQDKRVLRHAIWQEADTPITMLRNKCLAEAEEHGFDFVLMLDSDNLPDLYLGSSPDVKPFWRSSIEFCLDSVARRGLPAVVAAPYCGPGPNQCVYVFDWVNFKNPGAQPNILDVAPDFKLDMVSRHEAAERKGILPAAAIPTGVCLIDMRAIKPLPHPRFDYEWTDKRQLQKASTEDVMFSRNISYVWQDHGPIVFCNWDAWAGHVKQNIVGKPQNYPVTWVPSYVVNQCREAVRLGKTPEKTTQEAVMQIRPVNSFAAPPRGFPVELIRTQTAMPLEREPEDEQPPAEVLASLNGVG